MDAANELSSIAETVDAIRADIAELRHETRRELDVIKTRLEGCVTTAEFHKEMGSLRDALNQGLLRQTRWMLAELLTVVVAIYFRT
jgi:hypothetical protein